VRESPLDDDVWVAADFGPDRGEVVEALPPRSSSLPPILASPLPACVEARACRACVRLGSCLFALRVRVCVRCACANVLHVLMLCDCGRRVTEQRLSDLERISPTS